MGNFSEKLESLETQLTNHFGKAAIVSCVPPLVPVSAAFFLEMVLL